MAICRIYEARGGSIEDYEGINQQLQSKLGENYAPDGAQLHIAGIGDGVLRVIEVWESHEHVERFVQEHLGQLMQESDLPQPEITEFEVHNTLWAD